MRSTYGVEGTNDSAAYTPRRSTRALSVASCVFSRVPLSLTKHFLLSLSLSRILSFYRSFLLLYLFFSFSLPPSYFASRRPFHRFILKRDKVGDAVYERKGGTQLIAILRLYYISCLRYQANCNSSPHVCLHLFQFTGRRLPLPPRSKFTPFSLSNPLILSITLSLSFSLPIILRINLPHFHPYSPISVSSFSCSSSSSLSSLLALDDDIASRNRTEKFIERDDAVVFSFLFIPRKSIDSSAV